MIKIVKNLYDFIERINDKEYAKALEKHITKIKLVAIGTLLKSKVFFKKKKEYYFRFKELGMFDLKASGLVKKTFKQKVIVFLVITRIYYITMLLFSRR